MTVFALSALMAAAAASVASAQDPENKFPATPLADKHFSYPSGIPYKVDTDTNLIRGFQSGYNICNSTTEGPNSMCQTAFVNSIDDWCVWAPSHGPISIAETEGEEVAWCTKPGRGTRLIPAGAIKGVQFLRAPAYLEVLAFLDQTLLNLEADDYGGELDPHGADLRGNPMGGLVFSNNLPQSGTGDNNSWTQVMEWHNFIGANFSCMKVCDPKDPDAANYCQHIFDRIGVSYTCPNQAQSGVFEICDSENQDFPGIYTSDGQVMTYTQPPESLGAITSMPYTARVPTSSNCVTFQSSDLFASLPTPTGVSSSAAATGSSGPAGTSKGASGSAAASRTGSATPSGTGSALTDGASSLKVSAFTTIMGVVFTAAFFA